jgi:hypothetical protein
MKLHFTFFFLAVSVLLLSNACEDDSGRPKIVNPNGDSELALLMRDMFDDGMQYKAQMLEGKNPDIHVKYKNIHTASATQPEKVATTEFQLFAKAYENAMDQLAASTPGDRVMTYQTVVQTCMNCHQKMCTGPLVKIRKMVLSENDLQKLAGKQ